MNRLSLPEGPQFNEGVLIAALGSLAAAVSYSALTMVLPAYASTRVLIAAIGLVYICYLLSRSGRRVGRISAIGLWCVATLTLATLDASFVAHIGAQLAMVWLVRCWFFHSSIAPALLDLALSTFAGMAGLWALAETSSVLLSVWTALLIQALFTAIPRNPARPGSNIADPFEQAHRSAEAACQRMTSH